MAERASFETTIPSNRTSQSVLYYYKNGSQVLSFLFNITLFNMKKILLIFSTSILLFLLTDFIITNYLEIRNFTKFHKSEKPIGHVPIPNFSGHFGSPLDNFYSKVNINSEGLRKSFLCKKIPINTLFVGDSTTAGFEVEDYSTFVSLINKNCSKYKINGVNAGVRAYDIHHVIANYERLSQAFQHKIVFYLVGLNIFVKKHYTKDFHHSNLIKRFGRAIIIDEEKISFIEPTLDGAEKFYLNLRVFISDNFYFFTKLIKSKSSLLSFLGKNSKKEIKIVNKNKSEELSEFINSMKILNNKVRKNNAKLVVAVFPCLYTDCERRGFFENGFLQLKNHNIEVMQLVKIFNEKSKKGLLKKENMRFPKDGHLSEAGHDFISKEIGNYLNQLISK